MARMAAFVLTLLFTIMFTACAGRDSNFERGNPPEDPADQTTPNTPGNPNRPKPPQDGNWISRGKWTLSVGESGSSFNAQAEQPINGHVPAAVTFTVANDEFSEPPPGTGVTSYGELDVTALDDNDLRICGNGNQKCNKATIRIYTTGTPGSGLWNDDEAFGLPILTNSNEIGLDAAGSFKIIEIDIAPNKRVLDLADFTDDPELSIPISVDYSEASAGDYHSTLVIEYLLTRI